MMEAHEVDASLGRLMVQLTESGSVQSESSIQPYHIKFSLDGLALIYYASFLLLLLHDFGAPVLNPGLGYTLQ